MKTKLLSLLSFFGLLVLPALEACAQGSAGAAAGQEVGRIVARRVRGEVSFYTTADQTKRATALKDNDVIQQGVTVQTGPNSSVVLVFRNGSTVSLQAATELKIEEFTHTPIPESFDVAKTTDENDPSVSKTRLRLERGELIGKVKKIKRGEGASFDVGTPVGAAGIRGTTFRIIYTPNPDGRTYNFRLTTIEGNVEMTIGAGVVTAPPGSGSMVGENREVVLNNVEVVGGQIVATSTAGVTVTIPVAPTTGTADASIVQQVRQVADQLAQLFVPPPAAPAPVTTKPDLTPTP